VTHRAAHWRGALAQAVTALQGLRTETQTEEGEGTQHRARHTHMPRHAAHTHAPRQMHTTRAARICTSRAAAVAAPSPKCTHHTRRDTALETRGAACQMHAAHETRHCT